jgi:dinuclear metal center YbgI/SA1388 family protein
MKISEIISYLESIAPLALQESYDNAGFITGEPSAELTGVLVSVDCTEAVVDEAVARNCNLVVSHHPIIFKGLKKITGKTYVERTVMNAIRAGISLYAAHTNLDSVATGVSGRLAGLFGLTHQRVLLPRTGNLKKLVTFVPAAHLENVRSAIFAAGAGHIGKYDQCSYSTDGNGTFRGSEDTNPFVGERGKLHIEPEARFETIFPAWLQSAILAALIRAHPYEEVAYDIYPLENAHPETGYGMTGVLEDPLQPADFLAFLRQRLNLRVIRHTRFDRPVKTVALCGGAGGFLLGNAIAAGADAFVTGDFKYHEFFDAEDHLMIADIGHYESEKHTKEWLRSLILEKFPTFAVLLSEIDTNPVNYFY